MSVDQRMDRRQAPRVPLESGVECRLELRTRVRLLDISLSGALLAAELALPVGAPAQLRSGLGATAFSADVQVRRNVALTPGIPLLEIDCEINAPEFAKACAEALLGMIG